MSCTQLHDLNPNTKLDAKINDFLENVYTMFGQYSAWRLVEMTHNEDPWRTTVCNDKIEIDKIVNFFRIYHTDKLNIIKVMDKNGMTQNLKDLHDAGILDDSFMLKEFYKGTRE